VYKILSQTNIFSSISIKCIVHQFLGPSIHNDYANMYLDPFKTIEIVHVRKYLILLRNNMKPILKVLTRKYTSATIFLCLKLILLKL